jgi:hypothetical protein
MHHTFLKGYGMLGVGSGPNISWKWWDQCPWRFCQLSTVSCGQIHTVVGGYEHSILISEYIESANVASGKCFDANLSRESMLISSKMTYPTEMALVMTISGNEYAQALCQLSAQFSYMNCPEEVLQAIQEAVNLHQQFAVCSPAVFTVDLTSLLKILFDQLSDLVETIWEAVDLFRSLAADTLGSFNAVLTSSLHALSNRLSDLNHQEL